MMYSIINSASRETTSGNENASRPDPHLPKRTVPSVSVYDTVKLGQSQIRLIKLLPGAPQDPIKCTLMTTESHTFELQDRACQGGPSHTTYEALSYVWSSDEEDAFIWLNGTEFSISANLNHALRCLRLSDVERILWVDATCINQEDTEEKSEQVRMMDRIYTNAENVLIHLGPEADDSELVMDYLTVNDSDLLNDDGELFTEPGARESRAQAKPLRQSYESERIFLDRYFASKGLEEKRIVQAAYAFFCRPWWTRMWVIQEAKLAKRDPIWYCGKRSTTMQRLRERLIALHNFTLIKKDPILLSREEMGADPRGRRRPWEDLMAWTRGVENIFFANPGFVGDRPDLSTWLERCSTRQSTDPRDRVFALVSMLNPLARYLLAPDYSRSVNDIFSLTSIYLLSFERSTQVFSHYDFARDRRSPSWSLDFTRAVPGLLSSQYSSVYKASPWYTEKIVDIRTDDKTLILAGTGFDEIRFASNIDEGASNLEVLAARRKRFRMLYAYCDSLPREKIVEYLNERILLAPAYDDYEAANCHIAAPQGLEQDYVEMLKTIARHDEELPGSINFSCAALNAVASHIVELVKTATSCDNCQLPCKPLPDVNRHRALVRTAVNVMTQGFSYAAAFEPSNLSSYIMDVEIDTIQSPASPDDTESTIDRLSDYGLNTTFRTAKTREELDVMKAMAQDMAHLCHSVISSHTNQGKCSSIYDIDEAEKRLSSAYANARASFQESTAGCTCSGGSQRETHQYEAETLVHMFRQEEIMFQHVTRFLRSRREAEGISNEVVAFGRERTAVFFTEANLVGLSFQHDPGFESGDKLVLMNGFLSPMVLREVDGGKYIIKGTVYVPGLTAVDLDYLYEEGVIEEQEFPII
ncbi:heterokaryon incompatibility protein-domain-containing protein [Xylariaceae sp. FL0016]|nr:heterokaryon incompatibility protein-domain-containing protein [Xylariaceae sp. FL0016]